jgi:hypothetical protein
MHLHWIRAFVIENICYIQFQFRFFFSIDMLACVWIILFTFAQLFVTLHTNSELDFDRNVIWLLDSIIYYIWHKKKRRRDFRCGFFSTLLYSALLFHLKRTESIHPDWRYTRNNNIISKKIIVKHKLCAKYFKWMRYYKYSFEYSPIRISLSFLRYERTDDN